jgi:hypothetical protein
LALAFATVANGKYKGDTVFVSDFVWYNDAAKGRKNISRVTFVGVDKTEASRHDNSHFSATASAHRMSDNTHQLLIVGEAESA